MKKLLWIKDSKKFWQVFSQEREKEKKRLRNFPFAKKIEILSRMQRLYS
jgi:hypothetical protein